MPRQRSIRFAPDLLVTDFRLPDLDGLELLQRAKQLDNNLPVIVITSHGEISGAIKAIKASAFDYMEKPAWMAPMAMSSLAVHTPSISG